MYLVVSFVLNKDSGSCAKAFNSLGGWRELDFISGISPPLGQNWKNPRQIKEMAVAKKDQRSHEIYRIEVTTNDGRIVAKGWG